MINTKKKIYIYNRYRYIYRSKNRYFIKYDRKYIDLFSIIKNSNIGTRRTGAIKGGNYHKKFLKSFCNMCYLTKSEILYFHISGGQCTFFKKNEM